MPVAMPIKPSRQSHGGLAGGLTVIARCHYFSSDMNICGRQRLGSLHSDPTNPPPNFPTIFPNETSWQSGSEIYFGVEKLYHDSDAISIFPARSRWTNTLDHSGAAAFFVVSVPFPQLSGPTTGSFNGLHRESDFLAVAII